MAATPYAAQKRVHLTAKGPARVLRALAEEFPELAGGLVI